MVLQLNAGVKNLFDAFQSDLDRGPDRDPAYVYGPSLPRSYFAGVKFRFNKGSYQYEKSCREAVFVYSGLVSVDEAIRQC